MLPLYNKSTRPLYFLLSLFVSFSPSILAEHQPSNSQMVLWYKQPANAWHEAMPLGNGNMGAMVYGKTSTEQIDLNDDTLWSGGPNNYNRPGASKHLTELRQLVKEKKFTQARKLGDKVFLGVPKNQQAYQPLGTLKITFQGHDQPTDYKRQLDMQTGIARVSYSIGKTKFTRHIFASYPDKVIVINLLSEGPEKFSFSLDMSSPHPFSNTVKDEKQLIMNGQVAPHKHKGLLGHSDKPGIKFQARIKVADTDGDISSCKNNISVNNTSNTTLIYTSATSYLSYKNISGNPEDKTLKYLHAVSEKPYQQLHERHVKDHRSLFDRVHLGLSLDPKTELPTDKRITEIKKGSQDLLTHIQSFQFGRYLMIASSRPGTQPGNLQGIWNQSKRPRWGSKWTLNINAEMNYWPAETCNLSECHKPLLQMLEELRVPGRQSAKDFYDCNGFVVHHNTDLWRGTAIVDGFSWGIWPMGAAWLCHHIWQHYDFSQDRDYLKSAYPTMKEAAEFFVEYLIEDENGYLVTSPSISFEQAFKMPDGTTGRVCMGPTMDMQILRAFFTHCINAGNILGEDKEFIEKLIHMRSRLIPSTVNPKTGRLREWRDDREPESLTTGQLGHLWGLCPGEQITPWKTPKISKGAENSLRYRKESFGSWCSGTRLNYWARLHNGQEYERVLNAHMRGHIMPNMFSCFYNNTLFQIDGNYGMTASVAEALLQSHAGQIHLLPALPPSWKTGSVKGLRARGNFEIDIQWQNCKLIFADIKSLSGNPCSIWYSGRTISLNTVKGKQYRLGPLLNIEKQ